MDKVDLINQYNKINTKQYFGKADIAETTYIKIF